MVAGAYFSDRFLPGEKTTLTDEEMQKLAAERWDAENPKRAEANPYRDAFHNRLEEVLEE